MFSVMTRRVALAIRSALDAALVPCSSATAASAPASWMFTTSTTVSAGSADTWSSSSARIFGSNSRASTASW